MTWPSHLVVVVESILERHYAERADRNSGRCKSATDAVAQKCQTAGYTSYKCTAKGCVNGIHWGDDSQWGTGASCATCQGVGYLHKKQNKVHEQTRRCKVCLGGGKAIPKKNELVNVVMGWDGPALKTTHFPDCRTCNGRGYTYNFDVNPEPEVIFGNPQAADTSHREGNVEVLAVLQHLQRSDPQAESCIRLTLGEYAGLKTRLGENRKRHSALVELAHAIGYELMLWPLTEHGKQLVERERLHTPHVTPHVAILVAMQRVNKAPDSLTSQLADMARLSASAMRMRALTKLYTADQQTGGNLMRQAESEGRRIAS